MNTDKLSPTQRSILAQPKNCVIRLTGDGPYKGQYVVRQLCDGFLDLTSDISEAHVTCNYYAKDIVGRLGWNAQYRYGGKFEIETIVIMERELQPA